jgi:hypothetical protein
MNGAYPEAVLLEYGAAGLLIVLAAASMVAGTMIRAERRRRFLLWCVAVYMAGWTLFVLYNTVVLTRYFLKIMHG